MRFAGRKNYSLVGGNIMLSLSPDSVWFRERER